MSPPYRINFENNERMAQLIKSIEHILGYVLVYSVIIFTTISALLGGIVVYPIYGVLYILKKIKATCCKSAAEAEAEATEAATETTDKSAAEEQVNKPIIDENWCNVSIKNIINYTNEIADANEIANEIENEIADANEIADEIEEILSVRKPSQEELRQFQEEEEESDTSESEADDGSPRDKYSIGHYKSKTYINDPLNLE
jgi:small-conductance mechanosensitive channel